MLVAILSTLVFLAVSILLVLRLARQIENGLPVLLHGHPHLDAQLALINRVRVGGQVVGLLEQRQNILLQPLHAVAR